MRPAFWVIHFHLLLPSPSSARMPRSFRPPLIVSIPLILGLPLGLFHAMSTHIAVFVTDFPPFFLRARITQSSFQHLVVRSRHQKWCLNIFKTTFYTCWNIIKRGERQVRLWFPWFPKRCWHDHTGTFPNYPAKKAGHTAFLEERHEKLTLTKAKTER